MSLTGDWYIELLQEQITDEEQYEQDMALLDECIGYDELVEKIQ
ncbi:hypothetical protein [Moraxella nasovis]|nr:hypothetical protein [Moraxella nasovis]